MRFRFSRELYSKEALIKTAYTFIDDFYIHLDMNELGYIVDIESKSENLNISEKEFINEMLIQETRIKVNSHNERIREILFSRAMASTIIEERLEDKMLENYDADEILVDWFDVYE